MADQFLKGLSCPACAGSLEIQLGTVVLKCKFCSANLVLCGDRGAHQYYVPLSVSKEDALEQIKKWFHSFRIAMDLRHKAQFLETFPVYIPFWRIDSRIIGWVCGENKKGSGKDRRIEHVERNINDEKQMTLPACDIGEFGVKWVDLQGDTILPFDLETVQKQGMTFGVLTQQSDALQQAKAKFQEWVEEGAGVEKVTFSKTHALNCKCAIVYYPLWVVRYEYKGRTYQVTADGETPQILYGRAPGNMMYRVLSYIGSVMGSLFLLTSLYRGVDLQDFRAYIALAVVAFAVVFWGYRQFRYGGEVKIEQKDKHKTWNFGDSLPEVLGGLVKEYS